MMSGGFSITLIILACVLIGVLAFMLPRLIKQTKKALEDKKKLQNAGPVIARMSVLAKQRLAASGFSQDAVDYSTAGYEYYQYKTQCHYEDNLHLVLDRTSRQVAFFQYIPFHFNLGVTYNDLQFFEVHKFEDIIKTDLTTNLGVVSSTSIGGGVGTGFGPVGVGVGISDTTSSQMVNSILVTLYFRDGKTATANFLNNVSVAMGGDAYNGAIMQAKQMLTICEQIVKENESAAPVQAPAPVQAQTQAPVQASAPAVDDGFRDLEKLEKLKSLMDKGVITEEEFVAQKKIILKM